jgi:8-oxo-dGTP diphosphatase
VRPVTEVAAGVLLRETAAGAEYLLARRPPDKVYAGYWEFPGGKVEPGETFREALTRELREELGITVTAATPWLCREFTYPHAHVRLKFFRVTGWEGEIEAREHSGVAWTLLHDTPAAAPMLPANAPILRALALPRIYAITHAEENGVDTELARIAQAAARGIRLMQVRDKTLPPGERRRFAGEAAALAAAVPGFTLLINDDETLAREIGASGIHLSSSRLGALAQRPGFVWAAASCHTAADLDLAERLKLDFAVLGPILPTVTHPESSGMGWETFARLVERTAIPVFALGGLRPESLAEAEAHGAHGIAMLRGW